MPLHAPSDYWNAISQLSNAGTKKDRAAVVKATGVSCLPLCVASPAFIHPSYFPLDPFHLFYENCMAFLWDLWAQSKSTDAFYIEPEVLKSFGELVSQAMVTLPPSFCGSIRDPFLKRNSQYKIYKWMALLHWYIIPIGIHVGFNPLVLKNFALFARAVEFAMMLEPRTDKDLEGLYKLIVDFLQGFEQLYVGDNPENISRARLCIFQLIHVPRHILWNGSIQLGSQATVERTIREMSHRVWSKKAVFANISNQIYEKELLKILLLYYPTLDVNQKTVDSSLAGIKRVKQLRILNREITAGGVVVQHLQAICSFFNMGCDPVSLKT